MPQPPTIQDVPANNTVRHGCFNVVFNLAGTLVAEDLHWEKGFKSVEFADYYTNDSEAGQPGVIGDAAYCATKGFGSVTVQLKNAGSVIFPGEFMQLPHQGFADIKCLVTNVGTAYTQAGATKVRVDIAEWMAESPLPSNISLDGNFGVLPCGPMRIFHPIPEDEGNIGIRQQHRVFRPFYASPALNSVGPYGARLVEDTEFQDTGVANVCTFDRVWAQLPGERNEPIDATKVYQIARYVYNISPFAILEAAVSSYSESIRANMNTKYFLTRGAVPAVGRVPFIQAMSFAGRAEIFDFGSGFPTISQDGQIFFNQNVDVHTIMSQHIEPYMGAMVKLITISGT